MTTLLGALLGLMVPLATPTQDAVNQGRPPPSDNANNNSVNRALSQPPSEDAQFARVPGGTATPPKDWKTGDKRGQPAEGKRKRRHRKHQPKRSSP
jgi:hypothetical protein